MADKEENKLKYAVKWRDRYIRELSAALTGREEETALLAAFLKVTFERLRAGEGEITIAKNEIAAGLKKYRTEVEDLGDAYRIRLVPCAEGAEKEQENAPEKDGGENA